MPFFDRLTEIMIARDVSKSDLARALGITPQAVGQWTKPNGTRPVGDKIEKIAKVLDVAPNELLLPVGSPFRAGGKAVIIRAERRPRLINSEKQLTYAAYLGFWNDLKSDDERIALFRMIKAWLSTR